MCPTTLFCVSIVVDFDFRHKYLITLSIHSFKLRIDKISIRLSRYSKREETRIGISISDLMRSASCVMFDTFYYSDTDMKWGIMVTSYLYLEEEDHTRATALKGYNALLSL